MCRLARPSQAEEFSAQDLTNLLLCFSRAGLASPPMLSAIEREIVAQRPGFSGLPINRLEGFTSQGLCNALWSFGVQRWYPSLSMDAMLQYITLSIADISDMELVLTLWACARQGRVVGKGSGGEVLLVVRGRVFLALEDRRAWANNA